MNPAVAEVGYVPEDLPALENGSCTYELVAGQLVEKHMGAEAALVKSNLVFFLRGHVRPQKLGFVLTEECGYQIFPGDPSRLRKPDVSFMRRDKVPDGKLPKGYVRFVPDLVAEIVSPNDLAEDVEARLVDFLRAGVALVWFLYPSTKTVHVYRPDGTSSFLMETGELSGENVLPGFTCRVEEMFEDI